MVEDHLASLRVTRDGMLRQKRRERRRRKEQPPGIYLPTKEKLDDVLEKEFPVQRISGLMSVATRTTPHELSQVKLSEEDREQTEEVHARGVTELKDHLKEYVVFSDNPKVLAEKAVQTLRKAGQEVDEEKIERTFNFDRIKKSKWDPKNPIYGFVFNPEGFQDRFTIITESALLQTGIAKNRTELKDFIREECIFAEPLKE